MTTRTWVFAFAPALLLAANPKTAPPPSAGVKTPGVLIPYEKLKSEAEITLGSAPTGFAFTSEMAIIAESAGGIRRFDAKTNRPFDPNRDTGDVSQPCGGLASGFASLWTATCSKMPALAKIDQPEPRPALRGPRPASAKPDAAKPPMAEAAKPGAPNSELPKPAPPPAKPKPSVLTTLENPPAAPAAIATSEDSVWLLADNKSSLHRIDPDTGAAVADIRLPAACTAVLFAESALWVACPPEEKLIRIDAQTNLIDKRIDVPAQPFALAAGEGSIWVYCRKEGKVARIDPKTNKSTATIDLGLPGANTALAFGEGFLWASAPGFPLMRIAPGYDKTPDRVVQQFHGPGGGRIAVGAGSVWVGSADGKSVLRLDPKRIQATLAE